jgi:protein tyrosine phosphatase (PTP) superfamily phosphohydrolase (DUF442 family)
MIKIAVLLLVFSATAFAQDATEYVELPRFQQVSERLYRGAQPRAGGIDKLRELGINTVINLRGASNRTRAEEAEARAVGLNYYNVSLPNWGRPQESRVAHIMALINAQDSGRIFIHCRDGVDRTGMIVALYRMTHDGWSADRALAEADRSGMRRTQFWMRDYTEDYGDRVQKQGAETALKSPHVNEAVDDRIGDSMRVVEIGVFKAQRATTLFLRKFSASFR